MEKIKSFQIDHDHHDKGFYLSGEKDGIYTYDLRFKTPNGGDYLSTASAHTIEHMFATAVRNSEIKDDVVYFGPMGCRTGFYMLLKSTEYAAAKEITEKCMKECLKMDVIPGSERKECGNYLDHNIDSAKTEIKEYLKVLAKNF